MDWSCASAVEDRFKLMCVTMNSLTHFRNSVAIFYSTPKCSKKSQALKEFFDRLCNLNTTRVWLLCGSVEGRASRTSPIQCIGHSGS